MKFYLRKIALSIIILFVIIPGEYYQSGLIAQTKTERLNKIFELFNKTHPDSVTKKVKYAEEALVFAKENDNKFIQAKTLLFLGFNSLMERNNDKARKLLTEAIGIGRSLNNEYLEAEGFIKLGQFLSAAINKPDSALILTKKAYSTGLSLNDTTLLKSATFNLVALYKKCNDPVKAISTAKTAMAYNKNDKIALGGIYSQLVLVYGDFGNFKEAVKYFNLALELNEETKNYRQIANLSNYMGGINNPDQGLEAAVKYRKKALDIYTKMKDPFGIGYTCNLLGMNYSSAGKPEEAVNYFKKAIEILSRIGNLQHLAFAYNNLAIEYIKAKNTDSAWPLLKKSIAYGESVNDKLVLSDAYKSAAHYFREKNDFEKAIAYLKLAEDCAKIIKNPGFLLDIYNEFSICYSEKGDTKNALSFLRLKNEISDTISKQNAQKSYIEMMVKYETARTKEEAIEAKNNISALKQESERNFIILWSIIGGISLLIIIIASIYWKKLSVFFSFYKNISRKPFTDKRNNKTIAKALDQDNSENVPIGIETVASLNENLRKLIEEEKKYLDSGLTLNETAKLLNTNTAYLSRIINEQSGMNFSNYINRFRIEEAKKLLNERKQDSLTFEGIGKSCGFLSRSAFNQSFKKFTGLTPTEYSLRTEKNP